MLKIKDFSSFGNLRINSVRKQYLFPRKAIALFLSVFLSFGNFTSYADTRESIKSREISIPQELGRIEESFIGNTGKTIIYIQDAHDSLEAQENIAKIIRHAVDRYEVKTVFEEGYEGPVPTDDYFGPIKDPAIRQKVSYFMLDRLRIGGAEYAHINRVKDFDLVGADSVKLHFENIRRYREHSRHRAALRQELTVLQLEIDKLANQYFPKELKDWMKLRKRLDTQEINLLDYLRRFPIEKLQKYPSLATLLSAETGKEAQVLEKAKALDAKTLFREMDALESHFAQTLLGNVRDQRIFYYYQSLALFQRLNDTEVTSDEYEVLRSRLQQTDTQELAEFIARTCKKNVLLSKRWEDSIQDAVKFYELARQRDHALEARLEEFSKKTGEGTAVLVFGGFHKEQIRQYLQQNGFSYRIITPRMTAADPVHKTYYRELMARDYSNLEIPPLVARASTPLRPMEIVYLGGNKQNAALRAQILRVDRAVRDILKRNEANEPAPGILSRLVSEELARSEMRASATDPTAEELVEKLKSPSEPVYKDALKELGRRYQSSFESTGEDFYYAARFFIEQVAGIPFTGWSGEDFKNEAVAAGLEALATFAKSKRSVDYLTMVYNKQIKLNLANFVFQRHQAETVTGLEKIITKITAITRNPGEPLQDDLILSREQIISILSRQIPDFWQQSERIRRTDEKRLATKTVKQASSEPETETAVREAIRHELAQSIQQILKTLSYRQREIMKLRYGLGGGYGYDLEEVGGIFKITLERVRQLEAQAVRELQRPSRKSLLVSYFFELREDPGQPILAESVYAEAIPSDIKQIFDALSYPEAKVLILLHGLLGGKPYSHAEAGKLLGIGRDEVIYLENRAFRKLRGVELKKFTRELQPRLASGAFEMLYGRDGDLYFKPLPDFPAGDFGASANPFNFLPEPILRNQPRKGALTEQEEDALLAWFDARVPPFQMRLIPYVMKGASDEAMAEILHRPLDYVQDEKRKLLQKLRYLFSLNVLNRFGSPEQVWDDVLRLFSESPLERFIRRNQLGKLFELAQDSPDNIKELILQVFPDQFTGQEIDALLKTHYDQIFPAIHFTASTATRARAVIQVLGDFVRQIGQTKAQRKQAVIKRVLRDLFYPLIRRGMENGMGEGITALQNEIRATKENTVWRMILEEILRDYGEGQAYEPRGYESHTENEPEQPLLPFQRFSIYQALKTLENPEEGGAWFVSDPRTGKTITGALTALNIKNPDGSYAVKRMLITVPNASKYEFAGELRKRISRDLDLQIITVDWEVGDRETQIRDAIRQAGEGKNVALIVNYNGATDFSQLLSEEFKPDAHLIDEIENLRRGLKSVRAPLIFAIPAKYRIGIAARPVVKRPKDVIEALLWLRKDHFARKGLDEIQARHRLQSLPADELFDILDAVMVRWKRQVVLPELKNTTEKIIAVPYSRTQEEIIASMRRDFIAWKRDHAREDKITEADHIFRRFDLERRASIDLRMVLPPERVRQLIDEKVQGRVLTEAETQRLADEILAPKLLELDKIIDDRVKDHGKVVVLIDFIEQIHGLTGESEDAIVEGIVARYNRIYGAGAAVGVSNEMPLADRNTGIQNFRSQAKPYVLVGTTQLLGSSLNLFQIPGSPFHISTLVRLSRPWMNYQDGERLVGIGQTHDVEVITLVSHARAFLSVEEHLQSRLAEESEFLVHIVEGTPVLDEESFDKLDSFTHVFMDRSAENTPAGKQAPDPRAEMRRVSFENKRVLIDFEDIARNFSDEQIKEIVYVAENRNKNVQILIYHADPVHPLANLLRGLKLSGLKMVGSSAFDVSVQRAFEHFSGQVVHLSTADHKIDQTVLGKISARYGIERDRAFLLVYRDRESGTLGVGLRDLQRGNLKQRMEAGTLKQQLPDYMDSIHHRIFVSNPASAGIASWRALYDASIAFARAA